MDFYFLRRNHFGIGMTQNGDLDIEDIMALFIEWTMQISTKGKEKLFVKNLILIAKKLYS